MGAVRASHPRFRREGSAPRIVLTEDDVAILKQVHRHRFVRADDLYRLMGRSSDRLSRRLTLLFRNDYLDRPICQVDRYHEGGSRALVYGLGNAGAKYLKETVGAAIGATDWRSRNRTYTRENLDHTLAISRFLINLELECRANAELSLIHFDNILSEAPEGKRQLDNPGCWPVMLEWHGGRVRVNLIPDAIFSLRVIRQDGTRTRSNYFLEIDRGTMTIAPSKQIRESDAFPYRATILRKFYAYADSHRQGLHERQFGIKAPRVLFLTSSNARADAMSRVAQDFVIEPLRLPSGLFLFGAHPSNSIAGPFTACDGSQVSLREIG